MILCKKFILSFALSVGLFFFIGVITAVIKSPWFTRMTPITWVDWFFLVLVSALIGTYTYIGSCNDNKCIAGGFFGFFAVSCPFCSALLVSVFGVGVVGAYIEPARPYMGVLGSAILIYLIWRKLKEKQKTAKRTKRKSKTPRKKSKDHEKKQRNR